jgi:hypothetical protein
MTRWNREIWKIRRETEGKGKKEEKSGEEDRTEYRKEGVGRSRFCVLKE